MVKIYWNPTPETAEMAKRAVEMQKDGWKVNAIAKFFRRHRTYIFALMKWYKQKESK